MVQQLDAVVQQLRDSGGLVARGGVAQQVLGDAVEEHPCWHGEGVCVAGRCWGVWRGRCRHLVSHRLEIGLSAHESKFLHAGRKEIERVDSKHEVCTQTRNLKHVKRKNFRKRLHEENRVTP